MVNNTVIGALISKHLAIKTANIPDGKTVSNMLFRLMSMALVLFVGLSGCILSGLGSW